MQSDSVRQEARAFAERLISLDPVEYDSAINQYFDANAKVNTTYCDLRGATTLKRMATFMARLATNSELEKEPVYDDKDQAIHFSFARLYKAPALPSYIPLSGMLARQGREAHWDCVAHFNVEDQEGTGADRPTLVVSKLEMDMREKPYFYPLLPTHLLRPMFSLVAVLVAIAVGFFGRHQPSKEGPVEMIMHAVQDVLFSVWMFLLGKKEEGMSRVDEFREKAGNGVPPMLGNVVNSVTAVAKELQERAKKSGIPVEEYMAKAADVAKQLEDRAKASGIPVEEYKKQVAKAIKETKKRGAEVIESLQTQTKVTAENVKSAADSHIADIAPPITGITANSNTNTDAPADAPATKQPKPKIAKPAKSSPLEKDQPQYNSEHHSHPGAKAHGGHTTQHHTHHESELHARPAKSHATGETDGEGRPMTPLGGHDPLAKEAFSYAQATAE